jgi:hypothetical protein
MDPTMDPQLRRKLHPRPRGLACAVAFAAALAAAPGAALADGPDKVVLAVDGADIYVDAGARDGVGAGSELELLHEVVVRDPRTGATLRDRFALGVLTVIKSGDRVSVAQAAGELRARVLAGDRVRLVSAARAFVDPWAERVAASRGAAGGPGGGPAVRPGAPARDPRGALIDHAELARAAWQDTLGKPPEQRIARWTALLAADPQTPYAAAIQRELASLKQQIAARQAALASAASGRADTRAPRIAKLAAQLAAPEAGDSPLAVARLADAVPGRPIELAFAIRDPAQVARAWLYVRSPGQAGFRRIELAPDGDAYLRATIGAEQVVAPAVQWYVEAAAGEEPPAPVLGSSSEPRTIDVEREVEEPPVHRGRSHIDAHVDYVDFDGKLGVGFDQYYQAEMDFTYRFLEPVYAVRLGFGSLSGIGGPKDIIDADPAGECRDPSGTYRCKRVTFSYVYTELEHRLRPNVAVMIRPQVGILTSDVTADSSSGRCRSSSDIDGCQFLTGFGGRIRVRLGDESGTNLVIGAGFTQRVGTLLEAAYHWRPTPVVPVQLTVQVTDQPVPEDFGVRLIADVGWRQLAWFYPSARLSYQARDIDHAGVSGGFALNFDW